jgi:hypothetical protein
MATGLRSCMVSAAAAGNRFVSGFCAFKLAHAGHSEESALARAATPSTLHNVNPFHCILI